MKLTLCSPLLVLMKVKVEIPYTGVNTAEELFADIDFPSSRHIRHIASDLADEAMSTLLRRGRSLDLAAISAWF